MAICNVFNKLTKVTGTFLTFSQYLEDLTKWNTESTYYRVVPSKFVALELPTGDIGSNIDLPKKLQDFFENGCSIYRMKLKDGISIWEPSHSSNLFWNTMFDIMGVNDSNTSKTIPCIKYVGDINLQSYNEHDGMGYSEIYCHIPNDAPQYIYSYEIKNISNYELISRNDGSLIEGYQEGELNGWEKINASDVNGEIKYNINNQYNFSWSDSSLATEKLNPDPISYQINSIIVLYDIYNKDEKIYEDIPLGLYITGIYDENGEIQNSITKYVCNEDIYNSGTSYGLRICSRFIATPYSDNYIVKNVELDNCGYSDTAMVLTKIAESQSKMDEIVSKAYDCYQYHKDTLSIFRNNRVNVPYIKTINGENYWFVNGRIISQSTEEASYDSYTTDELRNLMGIGQGLRIIPTVQNTVYDITDSNSHDINISWNVTYNGKTINPDKTTLEIKRNNTTIDTRDVTMINSCNHQLCPVELEDGTKVHYDTIYYLKTEYRNMVSSTTIKIIFTNPSYFGLVTINDEDIEYLANRQNYTDICLHSLSLDEMMGDEGMDKIVINWDSNNPFDTLNNYIQEHKITITDPSKHQHICLIYPKHYTDEYEVQKLSPEVECISDENGYIYYINTSDSNYVNDYINISDAFDEDFYVYINRASVMVENCVLKFK